MTAAQLTQDTAVDTWAAPECGVAETTPDGPPTGCRIPAVGTGTIRCPITGWTQTLPLCAEHHTLLALAAFGCVSCTVPDLHPLHLAAWEPIR